MPLVVAFAVLVGLTLFMFYAFAREEAPGPAEVAEAYEAARCRGDLDLLHDLSAPDRRKGRRADFVAAQGLAASDSERRRSRSSSAVRVTAEEVARDGSTALVATSTDDGRQVRRGVLTLACISGGWYVVNRTPGEDERDAGDGGVG